MTKQEMKDMTQVIGAAVILVGLIWLWQDIKKEEEAEEQATEQQQKEQAQDSSETAAFHVIKKAVDRENNLTSQIHQDKERE